MQIKSNSKITHAKLVCDLWNSIGTHVDLKNTVLSGIRKSLNTDRLVTTLKIKLKLSEIKI
jgi:hypothetical protein